MNKNLLPGDKTEDQRIAEWLGVKWSDRSQCTECGLTEAEHAATGDTFMPPDPNPDYSTPEGSYALIEAVSERGFLVTITTEDEGYMCQIHEWKKSGLTIKRYPQLLALKESQSLAEAVKAAVKRLTEILKLREQSPELNPHSSRGR